MKIVFFDVESVPATKPTLTRKGLAVPNSKNSKIVQWSLLTFDGQLILPNTNINPQVDWKDISGFTSYVERAWNVKDVAKEADRFPDFKTAFPAFVQALKTVGNDIVLTAHNGNGWDYVLLSEEMRKNNLVFPADLHISTWDTRSLFKRWSFLPQKDKKWNLGYLYEKAFPGTKIAHQHTAEGDVKAMQQLAKHFVSRALNAAATEKDVVEFLFEKTQKGVRSHPFQSLTANKEDARLYEPQLTLNSEEKKKESFISSKHFYPFPESKKQLVLPERSALSKYDAGLVEETRTVAKKHIKHGVVEGLGRTTVKRIKMKHSITHFHQLFSLYSTKEQFHEVLHCNAKKSLYKTTIHKLNTMAEIWQCVSRD